MANKDKNTINDEFLQAIIDKNLIKVKYMTETNKDAIDINMHDNVIIKNINNCRDHIFEYLIDNYNMVIDPYIKRCFPNDRSCMSEYSAKEKWGYNWENDDREYSEDSETDEITFSEDDESDENMGFSLYPTDDTSSEDEESDETMAFPLYSTESIYSNNNITKIIEKKLDNKKMFYVDKKYVAMNIKLLEEYYNTTFDKDRILCDGKIYGDVAIISNYRNKRKLYDEYMNMIKNCTVKSAKKN